MKVYALSRAQAENVTDHYPQYFGDDDIRVSIISIGPPGKTTADLDETLFDNVLRLHFHDADPNVSHGQVKGMMLMNNGQVKSIIEFVENHDPDTLFVQCQAGQSRSCGVAYALHKHYNNGGDLKQGWDNYNRFVDEKVSESLRGYSKDQEYYKQMFSFDE